MGEKGLIRNLISDLKGERAEDLASSGVSRDISVSLTQMGRDKVDGMTLKSPYSEVLYTIMEQGGTSTSRDISRETHIPRGKVEAILKSLEDSQYVKTNRLRVG